VNSFEPTTEDVDALRALIDLQESAIDSKHKPASPAWPLGLIKGHNDAPRNHAWRDGDEIVAWASMQPDEHRHRIEVELFRIPGYPHTRDVWNWVLDTAATDFPGWVLWPTINNHDDEMVAVLAETGFALLRRYHFLTRPLGDDRYPELPENVSIDVVSTDADYLDWHAAHQDSFSHHFGFTPRPAEPWIKHFRDAVNADPTGRFLLRVDGAVVGFVSCSNDNEHENGGFIDLLGVREAFHGRGFGKLLLEWAFAYSAGRGFTDVDLAVDTGNTSGALRLYTSVGFTTLSEFQLYARPE
jgi:ribosomal protein S18 acetylase RimI-like enzyme